ncbi:MAG: hypothetical protein ACK4OO_00975 [bacterium]
MELKSGLKLTLGRSQIKTDLVKLKKPLDFPIESVELNVNLKNSLPLGATVWLLLGNDSTAMDTVLKVPLPRGTIRNRRVISAVDTFLSLFVDSSALRKMRQEPVFTRQLFELASTQGDTIWIYPEDSLSVQASATIHYTINGE